MHLPLVGMTMGDPTGIGPEIIVKALSKEDLFQSCRPVVLGDQAVLSKTIHMLGVDVSLDVSEKVSAQGCRPGKIRLIPVSRLDAGALEFGRPDRACGKAMVTHVEQAAQDEIQDVVRLCQCVWRGAEHERLSRLSRVARRAARAE